LDISVTPGCPKVLNEILENAGWVYGIIAKDLLKLLAGPFRVTILMPLAGSNPRRKLNR
jgi:hypothetical protein